MKQWFKKVSFEKDKKTPSPLKPFAPGPATEMTANLAQGFYHAPLKEDREDCMFMALIYFAGGNVFGTVDNLIAIIQNWKQGYKWMRRYAIL